MSILGDTPVAIASDACLSTPLIWGAIGAAGLLRPHSLTFVGRMLFPLGAATGLLLAATFTGWGNRHLTFGRRNRYRFREWWHWILSQAAGGLCGWVGFTITLRLSQSMWISLTFRTLAGMVVNYLAALLHARQFGDEDKHAPRVFEADSVGRTS